MVGKNRATPCLSRLIDDYREQWMLQVLERDNRIFDSTLIGNLMGSVSFLASTSMIIIGGLMAALGATEQTVTAIQDLSFISDSSVELWELKLLVLLIIFVYSFFKFT